MKLALTFVHTATRGVLAVALAAASSITVSSAGRAAVLSEDPGDQTYLTIAINEALETQKTDIEIPLRNPDTGSHGTLVIERTYYRDPTTPCRDYRRSIQRAGAPPSEVRGTGCRIGKALWSIDEVSVPPAARPPAAARGAGPVPLSPRKAAPSPRSEGPAPAAKTGSSTPSSAAGDEAPPPPFPGYTLPSRAGL
jgi:surface antigen